MEMKTGAVGLLAAAMLATPALAHGETYVQEEFDPDSFTDVLNKTAVEGAAQTQFPDCPRIDCEPTDEHGRYSVYCTENGERRLVGYITWTNMPGR